MSIVGAQIGTAGTAGTVLGQWKPTGTWIAYYSDFSEMAPFGEEVEALRYAVANGMQVIFVAHGVGLREAVRAHDAGEDAPSGR